MPPSEQLSLSLDNGPAEESSFFLALLPKAEANDQINLLARQLCATLKFNERQLVTDRAHVTLHYFGKYFGVPPNLIRDVTIASAAVAAEVSPFEVGFDRVQSFPGKPTGKPFVMLDDGSNAGLMELHRRLGSQPALAKHVEKSTFTPHVTLLYDRQSIAETPIETVCWLVDEFVLVRSFVGLSRYEVMGRWTLGG